MGVDQGLTEHRTVAAVERFRIAGLVPAIRIRGITPGAADSFLWNLSAPVSLSDGMFCILRRCRISFTLSEDSAPSSARIGKRGVKAGQTARRAAISPLKSKVIHEAVLHAGTLSLGYPRKSAAFDTIHRDRVHDDLVTGQPTRLL